MWIDVDEAVEEVVVRFARSAVEQLRAPPPVDLQEILVTRGQADGMRKREPDPLFLGFSQRSDGGVAPDDGSAMIGVDEAPKEFPEKMRLRLDVERRAGDRRGVIETHEPSLRAVDSYYERGEETMSEHQVSCVSCHFDDRLFMVQSTAIHAKRFDVLQGIDAASLILYKVCRSSLWHLAYVLRIFP